MKTFLIYFFLFRAFLFTDVLCRNHRHQTNSVEVKIVGGNHTNIESFPYQALLIIEKEHDYAQCGGSILNEHTVLTAAHCLFNIKGVYVRTGSSNSGNGGDLSVANNYTIHPKYNHRTHDYDVAVVRPLTPIRIDGKKIKVIQLASKGSAIRPGTTVILSGWGSTSESGNSSDNLMAVEVPTISNDQCRKSYESLTERMFCAGYPEGGKDSCQGDSGGPVVSKESGIQLGIVSYGQGCGREDYPGVYTRVPAASIRDWINEVSGV